MVRSLQIKTLHMMDKILTPNPANGECECTHKLYDMKAFKVELNFAIKIPMSSIAKALKILFEL